MSDSKDKKTPKPQQDVPEVIPEVMPPGMPPQVKVQLQDFQKHLKTSRTMAIIAGLIMVILGVLFFIFPLPTAFIAGLFIIIGLFTYGVYLIAEFVRAPAGLRNGWGLAQGLIFAVCSAMLLISSASSIVVSFAFLLGVMSMMIGTNEIIAYSTHRAIPGSGLMLFSGIINVLLAFFLFIAPIAAAEILVIVQGIYLLVTGVALVIEGIAMGKISNNSVPPKP